uniref:Uncharacterized protein TCIL3000_10_7380 n=1 Tax=Trypanosoma congolense (strain IL3000) TaxID=1068625 RepID=G0UX47_TRYCI|nr:unnamed protein product [Trypanosoma congolense IL3000]
MISGGAGGNCAAHQGSSPCDAAAKLCAFLMVRRNWSRQQISQTLGVPPLVVEECIRNGVSSEALCGRIARWIAESGDDSLPQTLVRAVTEAASDPSSENDTTECQLDGDPIAALDPVTRAYFAELGSSIGQSFISILNDPRQNKSNFKWGSWFVGLVSNALDGTITQSGCRRYQLISRRRMSFLPSIIRTGTTCLICSLCLRPSMRPVRKAVC